MRTCTHCTEEAGTEDAHVAGPRGAGPASPTRQNVGTTLAARGSKPVSHDPNGLTSRKAGRMVKPPMRTETNNFRLLSSVPCEGRR
jgi:hypothetical protein